MANFTAYLAEARASRRSEDFGTGIAEGVIAPEASNNACVAGALIPTLTLGIPGGGVAAGGAGAPEVVARPGRDGGHHPPEGVGELPEPREPVDGVLLETPEDEIVQLSGHRGVP